MIPARTLSRKLRPEGLALHEARHIAGTLSQPSKMPGYGYGLPARECAVGSKLRDVPGSVCHGCYAMKGNYTFGNVQASQYERLDAIQNPAWVDAMVTLISATVDPRDPYFRWHDSGDLQDVAHLHKIAEVARRTPWVRYWLPTREYQIVRDFMDTAEVPPNLVIRLSAHMIDGKTPDGFGLPVSGVHTEAPQGGARRCPAPTQGNSCGECRSCWDPKVRSVSYHKH